MGPTMSVALWAGVMLLGGVGAVLRFVVDREVSRHQTGDFPYGILVVNLTGAAVLGLVSGLTLGSTAALLAGTALVGSYTTFSTWMLQTHRLGKDGKPWRAAANIGVSLAVGLAAAWLGQSVGAQI